MGFDIQRMETGLTQGLESATARRDEEGDYKTLIEGLSGCRGWQLAGAARRCPSQIIATGAP
ncbi:transposase [Alcaligenes faecalis subsp. faecalis]|nr:transposase [Alcaligenes faecalis subsp. faecalis]